MLCGLEGGYILSPALLEHAEIAEVIISLTDFLRGKISQNDYAVPWQY